jgi:hypothetical protein
VSIFNGNKFPGLRTRTPQDRKGGRGREGEGKKRKGTEQMEGDHNSLPEEEKVKVGALITSTVYTG